MIREIIKSCDNFSVDLDFNLLDKKQEQIVYEKLHVILLKYGKIADEAMKFYGPIIVLDYGVGERKLKVEVTNRVYDNHYEIKNLLGISMNVLVEPDMFAHKLCALLDRPEMTNRDVFDCWFFMQRRTPVNQRIIEERMEMSLVDYLQRCIESLERMSDQRILNGLGELMDENMKKFVRTQLRKETISLLQFYQALPILTKE